MRAGRRTSGRRGSTIIEFMFITVVLLLVILAGIEFDRMILVYTTLADAARAGARYAIVHGSSRTGGGIDGPSGDGNTAQVEQCIRNFASAGLLDSSAVGISVTYPDTDASTPPNHLNTPGSRVVVQVTYRYDPFTVLPLGVSLSATTQGIITY
jgi:Flp pilus assembly protein TadG